MMGVMGEFEQDFMVRVGQMGAPPAQNKGGINKRWLIIVGLFVVLVGILMMAVFNSSPTGKAPIGSGDGSKIISGWWLCDDETEMVYNEDGTYLWRNAPDGEDPEGEEDEGEGVQIEERGNFWEKDGKLVVRITSLRGPEDYEETRVRERTYEVTREEGRASFAEGEKLTHVCEFLGDKDE